MDDEGKHPGGRPSAYDPAFCEQVIELGKLGMSPAEIAMELGHPRTTMLGWADAHEEFSTALIHARDFSLAWWERQAREGLNKGAQFNTNLWAKAIGGRFPQEPYRERVQLTGKDDGPIQHEHDLTKLSDAELDELEKIAAKLGVAGPAGEDRS